MITAWGEGVNKINLENRISQATCTLHPAFCNFGNPTPMGISEIMYPTPIPSYGFENWTCHLRSRGLLAHEGLLFRLDSRCILVCVKRLRKKYSSLL